MNKVTVQISKTSDGKKDYMQIMSEDYTSLNIVLVVDQIEVKDVRKQ
jgi:hypothetical protein